jgi:hypothetical protein
VTDPIPPSYNPLPTILIDSLLLFAFIGAIIFWLHTYKKPHRGYDINQMSVTPTFITTFMLVLAIFGPVAINVYPYIGPSGIIALMGMVWQIPILGYGFPFFGLSFFFIGLLISTLRLVYVYMIYRYYREQTTRKRVVIAGILGELQMPLIGLAIIPIGFVDPMIAIMFSIPVPILLIVGLLILHLIQVPRPIDGWTELDESQDWWNKEQTNSEV